MVGETPRNQDTFYVHDSYVLSFTVDGERQEIRLRAAYPSREGPGFGLILFTGVEAYRFEGDNFGTILFDISEVPASALLAENAALFEAGRRYAWPGHWNTSPEAVLERIERTGVKGFVIHASYGMSGWVWARALQVLPEPASESNHQ